MTSDYILPLCRIDITGLYHYFKEKMVSNKLNHQHLINLGYHSIHELFCEHLPAMLIDTINGTDPDAYTDFITLLTDLGFHNGKAVSVADGLCRRFELTFNLIRMQFHLDDPNHLVFHIQEEQQYRIYLTVTDILI